MTRHRRPTKTKLAQARALVAVLEPDHPRPSLWERMAHAQQTCGGLAFGCPLCLAETTDARGPIRADGAD